MRRNQAQKRHFDQLKKKRKVRILKNKKTIQKEVLDNEVFVGKLNKGKIHCSCPLCQTKTRKNGHKHSEKKFL